MRKWNCHANVDIEISSWLLLEVTSKLRYLVNCKISHLKQLLLVQEVIDKFSKLDGELLMEIVAAVFEDLEPTVRNLFGDQTRVIERDERVLVAVEDQGRTVNVRELLRIAEMAVWKHLEEVTDENHVISPKTQKCFLAINIVEQGPSRWVPVLGLSDRHHHCSVSLAGVAGCAPNDHLVNAGRIFDGERQRHFGAFAPAQNGVPRVAQFLAEIYSFKQHRS